MSKASLPSQVADSCFALSEQKPYPEAIVASDDAYYVFRLLERKAPAPDLLSEREEQFKKDLLEREKATILASWLAYVKSKADIKINNQLL